jgi:23S rRNA pseudouridine1911/1915/1917 synthase
MNAGFTYREQVGPGAAGRSVLAYLSGRYRHSSEAVWAERIGSGQVQIDDATARVTDLLHSGQRLAWHRPPWEEPEVPLSFAVLYRDDDLLAVAKPRGLPSLPGGGFLVHTLLHRVRTSCPEATPMHRLGRGTSGLFLFARTVPARRRVAAAWRAGGVEKTYRALVRGVPPPAFDVDTPIGLVFHPRLGRVHAAAPDGKRSLSHARRIAVRGRDAVVEVQIPTGRPHQIRIHMAAAGHPLVGDTLYAPGGGLAQAPALPGEAGYWLHAERLVLQHPATGRPLVLSCIPPPVLRV